MHVKFCQAILGNRKVMPLDFLMSTNFNVFSLNLVSNRRSSMNLKLSVLDYGVVMQVAFLQDDVLSNRGELAIWFQNVNDFFAFSHKLASNGHETTTEYIWPQCDDACEK